MAIPLSREYQNKGHISGILGADGGFMWAGAKKTTYQARDNSKLLPGTRDIQDNTEPAECSRDLVGSPICFATTIPRT